jgi:2-phosphosulfolactate phosphatase
MPYAMPRYQQHRGDLAGVLRLASHGRRLLRLGCDEDIEYCAAIDTLDVVPAVTAPATLTPIFGVIAGQAPRT